MQQRSPECSKPWSLNAKKALPIAQNKRKISPGVFHDEITEWNARAYRLDGPKKKKVEVFASPIVTDNLAVLVSIAKKENIIVARQLRVKERIITKEHPLFLGEQAAVLALDVYREYITGLQLEKNELFQPTIYAGTHELVHTLRTWCETGVAKLATATAPDLIRGFQSLEAWLQTKLVLRPQVTPMTTETGVIGDLPAICVGAIKMAEEFRRFALPLLGRTQWIRTLPRVPLAKLELREHVSICMRQDELLHIKKLAELGSDSARVICKLKTERPYVREAFRRLKGSHGTQVALATILRGTRFKRPYEGLLLLTERQNKHRRREMRGAEDSSEHLVRCNGLHRHWGTGVDSTEFMVIMARRAVAEVPGINIPKYIT